MSPLKLKLKVYTYNLNNRSSETFYGPIIVRWGDIKDKCLNHVRSHEHIKSDKECGWHFTSMAAEMRRKLGDSYTEESYATNYVMDNLDQNIKQNKDFLGRNFTYKVDESEWPEWLKIHREDYKHLLK